MNIFKRELAPVTDEAWTAIEAQLRKTLRSNLTARRIAEVVGPRGLDFAAVPLGRVAPLRQASHGGVHCSLNQVLPLLEVQVPFELSLTELDQASRGARDMDLDAVIKAAKRMAAFEDAAILKGFPQAGIQGIEETSAFKPLMVLESPDDFIQMVSNGLLQFQTQSIEGSVSDTYTLIAGPALFQFLASHFVGSYTLLHHTQTLIKGDVLVSPVLDNGLLVLQQPEFFELTLGQDFTLGYHSHTADTVRLYLMETFTFRVLNPQACLVLRKGIALPAGRAAKSPPQKAKK